MTLERGEVLLGLFVVVLQKLLIFLYWGPLVSEVCTTLRSAHNSRVSLDRFSIRLAVLSVAYWGRVWQVTILAMFRNFKKILAVRISS
jgi:hypothetical protein